MSTVIFGNFDYFSKKSTAFPQSGIRLSQFVLYRFRVSFAREGKAKTVNWFKHLLWKDVTQDPQYDEVQVPCPEITIPGVPQELYDKLLSEATAAGATFDGNTAEWHGCTLSWLYDAPSQTLSATCTKKPFYIACSQVEQGLRNEVVKAKAGL